MKSRLSFSLLSLFGASALTSVVDAAPLVSIGDNATVHFLGSAKVVSDSNIFNDETNEVDDLIFSVIPGLELKYGSGQSNATFGAITQYEVRRYADRDELDSELLSASVFGGYEGARIKVDGRLAYNEAQSNTGAANIAGALIESERTTASLSSEYRLSQKFKLGLGVTYVDMNYVTFTNFVADYETVTVPLDLYYELTPKLDVSAGYSYSDKEIAAVAGPPARAAYDTQTHFYNVGLRGELLPKLTGFVKVGYRTREQAGTNDKSSLGVDGNLVWSTTAKLTNTFVFGRDYGIGGNGQSTERTSFSLNSAYAISSQYSARANLGYTLRDYQGAGNREDDLYTAGLSFVYNMNEYWSFIAGYNYTDNESSLAGQSYESNRISLTASLRY